MECELTKFFGRRFYNTNADLPWPVELFVVGSSETRQRGCNLAESTEKARRLLVYRWMQLSIYQIICSHPFWKNLWNRLFQWHPPMNNEFYDVFWHHNIRVRYLMYIGIKFTFQKILINAQLTLPSSQLAWSWLKSEGKMDGGLWSLHSRTLILYANVAYQTSAMTQKQ
jgi:hypothetical protein